MHATRARLPQKRIRNKPAAKKPAAKKVAKPQAVAQEALDRAGIASLAAHRRLHARAPQAVEIFALVEWIAPARESWCRGELEVRRAACMPMLATLQADGSLSLGDLPGQGDALVLEAAALLSLRSGSEAAIVRTIPGMRVTLTAEELAQALPVAPRRSAQVLAFPGRR